ncbi:MAG TPA: RHS repeat-associated core domain-containing protein [Nannocystis exedens]|nr:RHS repeat-associated core domain-containing protein [Nannocystis exedens]
MRQDAELDGDVDSSDAVHAHSITGAYQTLGRGILSSAGVNNRRGYAGYEYDPTFEGAERHLYHVRHRVYDADVGRWTRRDPLGYVDGMSLYEYVASRPVTATDPDGLSWWACFKCFRELRRLGKQDHCKRKQCEDDCYEKHCGDYFAIAECLEACRQKVRKCIDDLKKTLPSCIKCAGPGKKSKIPTAPRLSTVSPTSSGGSAITASSSTPSGCPDDGESSDSDSCDDSGSNITSE